MTDFNIVSDTDTDTAIQIAVIAISGINNGDAAKQVANDQLETYGDMLLRSYREAMINDGLNPSDHWRAICDISGYAYNRFDKTAGGMVEVPGDGSEASNTLKKYSGDIKKVHEFGLDITLFGSMTDLRKVLKPAKPTQSQKLAKVWKKSDYDLQKQVVAKFLSSNGFKMMELIED